MKNAQPVQKNQPGAFDALTSALIVLANSPTAQQALLLLALMLFALQEVAL